MIVYEWDYETWEDGEVIDHDHEDKLKSFTPDRKTDHLVLVRNEGSDAEGLTDRHWAYVVEGKLPEFFSDTRGEISIRVPVRFHNELKNHSL